MEPPGQTGGPSAKMLCKGSEVPSWKLTYRGPARRVPQAWLARWGQGLLSSMMLSGRRGVRESWTSTAKGPQRAERVGEREGGEGTRLAEPPRSDNQGPWGEEEAAVPGKLHATVL